MKADTVLNSGQVKCGSLYETTETDEGGDNSMNIYCDNFLNFVFFFDFFSAFKRTFFKFLFKCASDANDYCFIYLFRFYYLLVLDAFNIYTNKLL